MLIDVVVVTTDCWDVKDEEVEENEDEEELLCVPFDADVFVWGPRNVMPTIRPMTSNATTVKTTTVFVNPNSPFDSSDNLKSDRLDCQRPPSLIIDCGKEKWLF